MTVSTASSRGGGKGCVGVQTQPAILHCNHTDLQIWVLSFFMAKKLLLVVKYKCWEDLVLILYLEWQIFFSKTFAKFNILLTWWKGFNKWVGHLGHLHEDLCKVSTAVICTAVSVIPWFGGCNMEDTQLAANNTMSL